MSEQPQTRGSRQSKRVESSHVSSIPNVDNPKSSKTQSKKTKDSIRPLSGGISQKVFKHGEGRSRVNNGQHNMSMFDRIGGAGNNKL